jgi:hypothetical protein
MLNLYDVEALAILQAIAYDAPLPRKNTHFDGRRSDLPAGIAYRSNVGTINKVVHRLLDAGYLYLDCTFYGTPVYDITDAGRQALADLRREHGSAYVSYDVFTPPHREYVDDGLAYDDGREWEDRAIRRADEALRQRCCQACLNSKPCACLCRECSRSRLLAIVDVWEARLLRNRRTSATRKVA